MVEDHGVGRGGDGTEFVDEGAIAEGGRVAPNETVERHPRAGADREAPSCQLVFELFVSVLRLGRETRVAFVSEVFLVLRVRAGGAQPEIPESACDGSEDYLDVSRRQARSASSGEVPAVARIAAHSIPVEVLPADGLLLRCRRPYGRRQAWRSARQTRGR